MRTVNSIRHVLCGGTARIGPINVADRADLPVGLVNEVSISRTRESSVTCTRHLANASLPSTGARHNCSLGLTSVEHSSFGVSRE
jgi:hypothetical protein